MELRQRALRLRPGSGVAEAPQLLGGGPRHDIAHLWHCRTLVDVFGGEGAYQRLVAEGVGSGALLEGHSADAHQVVVLAGQRAHHVELVAADGILIRGGVNLPLQFHGAGIGQLIVGAEAQQAGRQPERAVQHGVLLVVDGLSHRAHRQLGRNLQARVLLGGRHQDEASVGVVLAILMDALRLSVLVDIGDVEIFHGLVAREGNLQHALLVLLRAGHHVVGLEVHVVGRRPSFHDGGGLATNDVP